MLNGVNIFLIGMMGVGKTTIGKLLAQEFEYQFIDTDEFIEQATGQSIPTIFAESGEAVFRQLETATLVQLSARTSKVIATGGGIVTTKENWSYLRHGVIIWLDASLDQLEQRLKEDTNRPLLQNVDLGQRLRQLSSDRQALYAQADIRITAEVGETAEEVTARVVSAIAQECEKKRQADQSVQDLNVSVPFQINQN
jgi:shikimate kinase